MCLGRGDEGDDEEYIEANVMEAVRMIPTRNQLFMTMASGAEVEVVHVNPTAGRLLYQTSTPTIFLKMADASELMLPIVVGELAIGLLMKAFRNEQTARPNCYELMRDMIESLGHEVRMVKITQRIVDTYYARIYIAKPGENKLTSVDARPSDAINLAVRCQVPVFVSKSIVLNDSVKIAYAPVYDSVYGGRSVRSAGPAKDALLDSPLSEHDVVAEEITLVRSMMAAVSEERYRDAASLRDELNTLRQGSSRRQLNKH
jgi:bifunctional DNase/RNase